MPSPLESAARRYGLVAAAFALLGLVALNLAPVVGGGTGLFLLWPLCFLVALYYAAVAHRGARWTELGADPAVERVAGGRLASYRTTVDGRRVTVTAEQVARVRPAFSQTVETPLETVDWRLVCDVEGARVRVLEGDEGHLTDPVRRALAAIEGPGRLTVDGPGGVVRLTAPGLLDDAEELRARAAAVAAVARAVSDGGDGGGESGSDGRAATADDRTARSGASASG